MDITPTISTLEELYKTSTPSQRKRYAGIKTKMEKTFGQPPAFFSRAPGRVNLIGEHIDYMGYPVLPFALEQDIVIGVYPDPSSTIIDIVNMNDELFPPRSWSSVEESIQMSAKNHHWTNYVMAGIKGVLQYLQREKGCGMKLILDGCVPLGSGLSSSSALVCASGIAAMQCNESLNTLSRAAMASMCASAERFIGLQGGGMDQAASFLGERDTALLIEFKPLRSTPVTIPSSYVGGGYTILYYRVSIVLTNSMVQSKKADTARTNYNFRVLECRLASAWLSKHCSVKEWSKVTTLREFQEKAGLEIQQANELCKRVLHEGSYTLQEVGVAFEMKEEEVARRWLEPLGIPQESLFRIGARARHVFEETLRVFAFHQLCSGSEKVDVEELGDLLNASHTSLDTLYECSCSELNDVTAQARKAGALGSRLTGAGWGGWTVSMVVDVDSFVKTMKPLYPQMLVTRPGPGACVCDAKDL